MNYNYNDYDDGKAVEHAKLASVKSPAEQQDYNYGVEGKGDENYKAYEQEEYDENLGEDFEDTPWVPPSFELAEEYKCRQIYGEGKLDFWKLKLTHVADLGIGVPLYFQFVKSSAIYFLICTILSIPTYIFASSGKQIIKQAQDGFGLYLYSFGNIGYDSQTLTYSNDSLCKTPVNLNTANLTCIHAYGREIQSIQASYIVTVCEFLQVLIFYFIILYLRAKTRTFKLSTERQICSVTDYSIMIRNIPPDTSEEQLIGHFSRLYPLDKPDWLGRPVLEDAKPVNDFDNTDDVMYYNTWVAEVNTHKKIGRFVNAFKAQQDLMTAILRSRAKMKMYNINTCHAEGPNQKKFLDAEKKMLLYGSKLDTLTEKIASAKKMVIKEESEDGDAPESPMRSGKSWKGGKSVKSNKSGKSIKSDHHIVADVCAAFVVFQYSESMARCLEDYQMYANFPSSLITPASLKLRGHTIQVMQAPQPDEMIWENIEVTAFQKRIRRIQSFVLTVIILIASFIAILQAESFSKTFLNEVPPLKACTSDIPAALSGDYSPRGARIARPPSNQRIALDGACSSILSESYYAIYAIGGDFNKPLNKYDLNACIADHGYDIYGTCPSLGQKAYCPCVSTTFKEKCHTIPCSSNYTTSADDSQKKCYTYSSGLIAGCFCMQELSDIAGSVAVDLATLVAPQCKTFVTRYVQSKGIVYLVSIVTVMINMVLLSLQIFLTKKESHSSIDREQGSLMLKIFVSTYFNLAIVYLLVFGTITGLEDNAFLVTARVLQGRYDDFNSEWYGAVGSTFVFAFILQGIAPIGISLVYYFVLAPFTRYYRFPRIKAFKSHSVVMQQDLNVLLVGPEFDITVSTAQNLALFFFAMTYASALPILMPISSILLFSSYYVDKLLICRYYHRPPYSGTGVMNIVLECLLYAGLFRLMISCWVFSNPDVFQYESAFEVKQVSAATSQAQQSQGYLPPWMESRLKRTNVFPLVLFIIVIIAMKFAAFLYCLNPLKLFMRYLSCICVTCKSNRVYAADGVRAIKGFDAFEADDDLRQENAPFTEDYFKYISDNTAKFKSGHAFQKHMDKQLTDKELREGWQVKDVGRYTLKQKHWTRIVKDGNKTHNVGEVKRTYEVINDFGCNSYSLEKVPAYKLTMIGLAEGTAAMAATAKQTNVMKSTKSGKGVMRKTASIMGVYNATAQPTSIVGNHYARRKSKDDMKILQEMEESYEEPRHRSKKSAYDGVPVPPEYANEGLPSAQEAFHFEDNQKLHVSNKNKYFDDENDDENDDAVDGDAFGTGLGKAKLLNLSNDADYEKYEQMVRDEDDKDEEFY